MKNTKAIAVKALASALEFLELKPNQTTPFDDRRNARPRRDRLFVRVRGVFRKSYACLRLPPFERILDEAEADRLTIILAATEA